MKGHMLSVSSTRCFSNIILFDNFETAYSFTANNFIKFTFIKYQFLFNDNKKKNATQNVAYNIINHLTLCPRHQDLPLSS